jgi:hypothetical protein
MAEAAENKDVAVAALPSESTAAQELVAAEAAGNGTGDAAVLQAQVGQDAGVVVAELAETAELETAGRAPDATK